LGKSFPARLAGDVDSELSSRSGDRSQLRAIKVCHVFEDGIEEARSRRIQGAVVASGCGSG
jgi:hypothetical protein